MIPAANILQSLEPLNKGKVRRMVLFLVHLLHVLKDTYKCHEFDHSVDKPMASVNVAIGIVFFQKSRKNLRSDISLITQQGYNGFLFHFLNFVGHIVS